MAKAKIDTSVFRRLAPRMMRDLMRDFAPLAPHQAAGAVGNGGGESGGFTLAFEEDPAVAGSKGGSGFFQWTGMTAKNPRRKNWEAYLRSRGLNPASKSDVLDYDANYGMLKKELQSSERATIPALRQARDETEATKIFMIKFERPGVPNISGRIDWTKRALDAYNAEEAAIAKNPVIKTSVPAVLKDAPDPEVVPTMKDGVTPVPDGIPKPQNNNKSFWAKVGGGFGLAGAGALKFAGQALPWVLLAIGLVVLFIYVLRPAYVRWRDNLAHAPEFADADTKTKLLVFVQGLRTKMLARLVEGLGALSFVFSYADQAVGGTGIDLNSFLPSISVPFTEMKVEATQYMLLTSIAVSRAFDYFRSIATSAQGTIDPALAVSVAAESQHIAGATPSPALAAVTDPGTLPVDVLVPIVEETSTPTPPAKKPRKKPVKKTKAVKKAIKKRKAPAKAKTKKRR